MLRNSSSPERYFLAAIRVRSPWMFRNPDNVPYWVESTTRQPSSISQARPNQLIVVRHYLPATPLIFSTVRSPPKPSIPIRIGSISVMSAGANVR